MPLKNNWANGDLFTPAAANDMANVVNAFGPPTATGQAVVTAADPAAARAAMNATSTAGVRAQVLGSKIRGGNITVKPGYNWRHVWAEWDWDNWVKPQVDRAIALRLNAVRFISGQRSTTDATISWTAWAANQAYAVDVIATLAGKAYQCITAGTSASSGGPSGTSSSISDGTVVWKYLRENNLAPITQAQYDARWLQLIDYCAQYGVAVYPNLCTTEDFDAFSNGDYQNATVTASVVTTAALLSTRPNVLAFDLFQEGFSYTGRIWAASHYYSVGTYVNNNGISYRCETAGTSASSGGPTGTGSSISDGSVVWSHFGTAFLPADALAMFAAVRAVCRVPLTMSAPDFAMPTFYPPAGVPHADGDIPLATTLWNLVYADPAGPDFIDLHEYRRLKTPAILSEYAAFFANKPIIFGEFGTNQSETNQEQTDLYQLAESLHSQPGVVGSFVWALADQGSLNNGNKAGVWANNGFVQANAVQSGAPLSTVSGVRTSLATILKRFSVAQKLHTDIVTYAGQQVLTNKQLTSPVITTPSMNSIRDANGNPFITFAYGSTVTSNLRIASAATGDVTLGVNSTDTDVNLYLEPKNAGFVGIRNGVAGITPKIQVGGPDTNLSLNLATKGSGKVQFNGVEAVDVSSSQSLTNKNLNSGTNTFPTLNQNTTGTAANITGTAAIANGGTGQTTAAAAITALTGSQTSGRYLRSDGTNAALAQIVAGDVPTLNQNTTGSAASLTTARKINGTDFNGTAAINPAPDAFLSTMGASPAWAFVVQSTIGSNQAVLAANSGFFVPIRPRQNISVSSLAWVVGLQSGNYDIGVYDSTGARLWSRGSTAVTTAGTQVAETVTDVSMVAGATYYIAWASDTTSSAVKGLGGAGTAELSRSMDGSLAVVSVASVFPLPSTVTIGTSTVNRFPFIALRGTSS
jgi:hypothetical protein